MQPVSCCCGANFTEIVQAVPGESEAVRLFAKEKSAPLSPVMLNEESAIEVCNVLSQRQRLS